MSIAGPATARGADLVRSRAMEIVKVDETAGVLFYTARSGDNPLKLQLPVFGNLFKSEVRSRRKASRQMRDRAQGQEWRRGFLGRRPLYRTLRQEGIDLSRPGQSG
mgnify:CR=1 FL=1